MSIQSSTDPAPLIVARGILRNAYRQIGALSQTEPSIRCAVTQLAEMAHDLTVEIEGAQLVLEVG